MAKGEGNRNKKCLAYILAFIVFQTGIILIFALTVMRIKNPKVRFGAIAVDNFSTSNSSTSSTSLNMRLLAQFTVKNTNFGHFKYVGETVVPKGRAKARKTKKFNIMVDISTDRLSGNVTDLGNDINSGVLRLSSYAKLNGKVHLMKVIKKNKSGEMNCNWAICFATRQIQNLHCK
ncbi:hypothetical protein ACH5RR_041649 [Cinchona calisaya]|uniref:Late embryogenesis abundant protein LEA-2 subgroup domain-containing protein n=1 Tax=Cinchona calisaya TaxID=153742 RepID=A0ABD2XZF3_9GENT